MIALNNYLCPYFLVFPAEDEVAFFVTPAGSGPASETFPVPSIKISFTIISVKYLVIPSLSS